MAIIKNSAKCWKCNDVLVSISRHDFVWCVCGNIFIDGGLEYFRRGAKDLQYFEDLSVTSDD